MIPLIRKPILASIIEHLKRYGVDQIIVTTSHLAPKIENYLRDGELLGVQNAYSFEGLLTGGKIQGLALGSAGGMKKIQDFSGFFDDTFIVVCGDALIDLDFEKVLLFHREKNSIATIVLKEVPLIEVSKYGVVQVNESGRIIKFQEKPTPDKAISTMINTGIYIFEPAVFDYIPPEVHYDIGNHLFPALAEAGLPFYGVNIPFQWLDIGTITDYWHATREILLGKVKDYNLPGQEIQQGIRIGLNLRVDFSQIDMVPPVYIGSSTLIEAGAKIYGPTVIGANCQIKGGTIIKECLIEDYTRVKGIANLERLIVFGNKCIDPSGDALDIQETDISWLIEDSRREEFDQVDLPYAQLISELVREKAVSS
jgi:mannose-1-phosphate guanylyltransferase